MRFGRRKAEHAANVASWLFDALCYLPRLIIKLIN